jgi:hypothetical protein
MMAKPKKTPPKPAHLTDAERHKRFKEMARETGADEDPEAFERAFASVVAPPKPAPGKPDGE